MKRPELLSPAGTLHSMRHAFAFGADAVYAGQPRYSLRARNNEFDLENLGKGIDEAHRQGKKLFVASNLYPHNAKVDTYMGDMEPVIALQPDALIMADPGLIMMVRERWPEMPVHLSVQSNTVNYAAVRFWQSLGLKRIILSRELSLDEVEDIRQRCPDIELEVFVHGALCIAYSGRCLLSGYFNRRDPNQGTCTNTCRWEYNLSQAEEDISGDIVATKEHTPIATAVSACGEITRHPRADGVFLLEEQQRPGEYMPVFEDEFGTYIMNSKDLRAVEHVERLVNIGVDSLKIEGRTKSHYYAARTAQVYRMAIDDAVAGRPFNPALLGALEGLSHRGYTDGFYQRHHSAEHQNYLNNHSSSKQKFVGEITGYDTEKQLAQVLAKNQFAVGDSMELILPQGNHTFILDRIENLDGSSREMVPGGGYEIKIPIPTDKVDMGLLARNL